MLPALAVRLDAALLPYSSLDRTTGDVGFMAVALVRALPQSAMVTEVPADPQQTRTRCDRSKSVPLRAQRVHLVDDGIRLACTASSQQLSTARIERQQIRV